jgi:hypothetical protein
MNKSNSARPRARTSHEIELRVIISNGNPAHDTRLKFEFAPDPAGMARVWLVRLPRLKNPDAFPVQRSAQGWDLRLDAESATQPLQILNYCPDSAHQWLSDVSGQRRTAPAELLILAHHEMFTLTIHQFE